MSLLKDEEHRLLFDVKAEAIANLAMAKDTGLLKYPPSAVSAGVVAAVCLALYLDAVTGGTK